MARRRKPEDDLAAAAANPPQHIPSGPKADFRTLMPGYRLRHDGWNQQRVQRFLDTLAHTGCVKDAARVAGMSRVAANRAQKRFPLFATACADALSRAQQGLIAIAYQRAVEGRETIIIRKGEEFQRKIEPSDSMLGLLIKRGDMSGAKLAQNDEDVLTYDEWKAGWIFKKYGGKWQPPKPEEVRERLEVKFALMRQRMDADYDAHGICSRCHALMPPGTTNEMLYQGEGAWPIPEGCTG
jgi:hypothetical protein